MGKNFHWMLLYWRWGEYEGILVSRREDALIVHGDRVIEGERRGRGKKISRGGSFHRAKSLGLSSREAVVSSAYFSPAVIMRFKKHPPPLPVWNKEKKQQGDPAGNFRWRNLSFLFLFFIIIGNTFNRFFSIILRLWWLQTILNLRCNYSIFSVLFCSTTFSQLDIGILLLYICIII